MKDLRKEGCPIGNKSGVNGGYFWARNEEELQTTINVMHSRALASLGQEAALKRVRIETLLKQYKLELDEQEQDNGTSQ